MALGNTLGSHLLALGRLAPLQVENRAENRLVPSTDATRGLYCV